MQPAFMSKIFSKAKRVFLAYWNNVFDGKITTIVGVFMIGFGIHRALGGAEFIEVTAYIGGGLAIAGFKDPGSASKPPTP